MLNVTMDYTTPAPHHNRSYTEQYLLITWSIISLTMAVCGNTLILLSVFYRAFRIDKFSLLVIKNLAVSDVYFNAVWVLPTLVTLICDNEWILGEFLCGFTTYLQYPPAIATIFFITLLSGNKWVRCQFPLRTLDMSTAMVYKVTVTVWGLAFIHPTLYLVSNETMSSDRRIIELDYYKGSCDYHHGTDLSIYWNTLDLTCAVIYCLIPSGILVASNIAIIKIVKSKGRGKIKMKNFFMIVALTYFFLLSYTPYTIKYLIPMLKVDLKILPDSFIVLTYFLLYVNSWANTCIYLVTNQSFRSFAVSLLMCKGPPKRISRVSCATSVADRRSVVNNPLLTRRHNSVMNNTATNKTMPAQRSSAPVLLDHTHVRPRGHSHVTQPHHAHSTWVITSSEASTMGTDHCTAFEIPAPILGSIPESDI